MGVEQGSRYINSSSGYIENKKIVIVRFET